MWPEVQTDELQPPVYKNGLGKPMKARIKDVEVVADLVDFDAGHIDVNVVASR